MIATNGQQLLHRDGSLHGRPTFMFLGFLVALVVALGFPSSVFARYTEPNSQSGEGQQIEVKVDSITVGRGAHKSLSVSVTADGIAAPNVALSIDSIDSEKVTAVFDDGTGTGTTNVFGTAFITVTGKSITAGTDLVVKATVSGVTGTGSIKVVAPTVSVESITVGQGARKSVMVSVTTDGGAAAEGVALSIDSFDDQKIAAAFDDGTATGTAITGTTFITVTGKNTTLGTNLVMKATVSGVTGTGSIKVVAPTVSVESITVGQGARKSVMVSVTTDGGAAAEGVTLSIDSFDDQKIAAAFDDGTATGTAITGTTFITVTGKNTTLGTNLVMKATVSGVTGTGSIKVVAPTVSVESVTVGQGAQKSLKVSVTADGSDAAGVEVVLSIDSTKATAVFGNSGIDTVHTSFFGQATVEVTGVAVVDQTNLVVTATVSGVTGTGIVTVTSP